MVHRKRVRRYATLFLRCLRYSASHEVIARGTEGLPPPPQEQISAAAALGLLGMGLRVLEALGRRKSQLDLKEISDGCGKSVSLFAKEC